MRQRQLLLLVTLGTITIVAGAALGILTARLAAGTSLAEDQSLLVAGTPTGMPQPATVTTTRVALSSPSPSVFPSRPLFATVTLTATSEFLVHQVGAGDTVYRLARRYAVTPASIIELNNLQNPDRLQIGMQLLIPNVSPLPISAVEAEGFSPGSTPATTPSATVVPPTATPEQVLVETPAPTELPATPLTVNGLEPSQVAWMPADTLVHSRAIFELGQQMGRNPRAFSKVGDSVIGLPFLQAYDRSNYDLGDYAYLQPVVDHFAGSFGRDSAGARIGLHSWTALDPMWADKERCAPNEGSVPCEIRLHNPSLIIIHLGSNDNGPRGAYELHMRRIVEYALANGVIPILGTKADRFEGSNANNNVVRSLAAEYQVPLWDFDLVAATLPGRGLDVDQVHLNRDGRFMQEVSALVVLDRLRREVINQATESHLPFLPIWAASFPALAATNASRGLHRGERRNYSQNTSLQQHRHNHSFTRQQSPPAQYPGSAQTNNRATSLAAAAASHP